MTNPPQKFRPTEEQANRPFQFTIRDLLLWTTAICIVLGVGYSGGIVLGYLAFSACVVGMLYWKRPPQKAIKSAALLGILLLGAMVLLPAINATRSTHPRNGCLNRIRHIALAINNYEATHGEYPPAYTVDAAGNRLHSWRTLLLPYLEQKILYDQIDFSVPWDAPANQPLTNRQLWAYQCPGHPQGGQGNFTTYVAVVGPDTMWPASGGLRVRDVQDGVSNTLLIIEIARTDIAWAEPRDLTVDEILAAYDAGDVTGMASFHPGGVAVTAFCDVHVKPIQPTQIDRETLRAMLTVAGGEVYDLDSPEDPPSYIPPRPNAQPSATEESP